MVRILGLFVLLLSTHLSAEQALRIGIRTGLPPSYYTETNPPKGVLPEIINAVLEPLDADLVYQINPRRRIIHQLLAGDVHITTLSMSSELIGKIKWPQGLVVSSESLLTFDVNLYKLSRSDIHIADKSELSSYTIGSSRHPKFLLDAFNEYLAVDVDITIFNKSDSLIKALLSGRVDFVLLSDPELQGLLRGFPAGVDVDVVYHLGVVKSHLILSEAAFGREEAIKHARFIDERILQLHQQGKIQAIVDKYKLPLRSEH